MKKKKERKERKERKRLTYVFHFEGSVPHRASWHGDAFESPEKIPRQVTQGTENKNAGGIERREDPPRGR